MALTFSTERGCTTVIFEGDYEAESALGTIDEALKATGPTTGLLLDLSDSTSFRQRSAEDLRGIASFLSTRRALFGSRMATVGQSDLAYGLLRMGTVFCSEQGIETATFRSRAEAVEWLCRPREG